MRHASLVLSPQFQIQNISSPQPYFCYNRKKRNSYHTFQTIFHTHFVFFLSMIISVMINERYHEKEVVVTKQPYVEIQQLSTQRGEPKTKLILQISHAQLVICTQSKLKSTQQHENTPADLLRSHLSLFPTLQEDSIQVTMIFQSH